MTNAQWDGKLQSMLSQVEIRVTDILLLHFAKIMLFWNLFTCFKGLDIVFI